MRFLDKTAVITGGSSGIGKCTGIELLKEGCKVIIIGKTKENVVSTINEMKKISSKCYGYVCDVKDEKKVKYVVNEIIKQNNKIDYLINCAGFSNFKEFKDESVEEINDIINTNLLGTIYFCKFLLPYMGEGHIVNISSAVGKIGVPNMSLYCAAKFGIIGFSESLYYELKKKGIMVSVVCPGRTRTEFFRDKSFRNFKYKKMQEPIKVAREIKKALTSRKFEFVVPWGFKLKAIFKETLTPIAMWYINKKIR